MMTILRAMSMLKMLLEEISVQNCATCAIFSVDVDGKNHCEYMAEDIEELLLSSSKCAKKERQNIHNGRAIKWYTAIRTCSFTYN